MRHLERYITQLDLDPQVEKLVRYALMEEERNASHDRPPRILKDLEQRARDLANERRRQR